MLFFSHIRKLFLAAFPQALPPWPLSRAGFLPGVPLDNAFAQPEPLKPRPILARARLEPNLHAPSLLSRFRIGPYANGPP
jgi:hypothetical protein